MAAVPKRAQNYIPISQQNKNRMKFAEEPRRIRTRQGNISYIEDRRIQKMPASTPRKLQPEDYYAPRTVRPQRPGPRPVAPVNAPRVSMQGEIAIPLPQTGIRKQPQQETQTAARPAGIVSTILLIAVVFGVLSFLLMRNATITNISLQNAEIQDRIETLAQNIDQLKLDITLKEDLGEIQKRAEELNMVAPASSQITYLTQAETTAVNAAPAADIQDTSLEGQPFSFDNLFKKIKSWLE